MGIGTAEINVCYWQKADTAILPQNEYANDLLWSLCPVWMAPFLQVLFCDWFFVRSSLVFGLLTRHTWPLALMVSTNQVPFRMIEQQAFRTKHGVSWF